MRRYLSIWFPEWPLDRLRRARRRPSPHGPDIIARPAEPQPFVLHEKSTHGLTVAAANAPAMEVGIHAGLSLKDARGALPGLMTEQIDREKLREELADVFAYAIMLAGRHGLDVSEIVKDKIAKNAKKYPVEKFKGSSAKYDDLG